MKTVLNFLAILGAFALIAFVLLIADKRTEELNRIGDCVMEHYQQEHFPGDYKQAWDTYYSVCE